MSADSEGEKQYINLGTTQMSNLRCLYKPNSIFFMDVHCVTALNSVTACYFSTPFIGAQCRCDFDVVDLVSNEWRKCILSIFNVVLS